MRVIRGLSTHPDRPVDDPLLESSGLMIELRGGDILHPRGDGDWFKPPYFEKVFQAFCRWPVLPFISWRIGNKAGYFGAKAFGVDSPAYLNFPSLDAADVYSGSQALMFSIRPLATVD